MGKFSAMSLYGLTMPHNVDSAHFGKLAFQETNAKRCLFPGVCTEEAPCGRVSPEDGGALRMCPLHSKLSQGLFTHCSKLKFTVMLFFKKMS